MRNDKGNHGSFLSIPCLALAACFIALFLPRAADAQCPNSAQAIGEELYSYSSVLGFTKGWLKCCTARFPSAAEELLRKYDVWATPGRRRVDALLTCSGTEASDARSAADIVQDRFKGNGEQDLCATKSSSLHCREMLDKFFLTTSVDRFAKAKTLSNP